MNIFEKLCRIQNELKAPKNNHNDFADFMYRNAEGILQAVKPLCLKYESTILLTDSIEVIEGRFFVKTIAELISWDVDGETAGKVVSAPGFAQIPSGKRGMDEAQVTGTASSYAKKRALESLMGISGEADSDEIEPTLEEPQEDAPQDLASEKQVGLIYGLAKKGNIAIQSILNRYNVPKAEEMSKEQASHCIGILKKQVEKKQVGEQ